MQLSRFTKKGRRSCFNTYLNVNVFNFNCQSSAISFLLFYLNLNILVVVVKIRMMLLCPIRELTFTVVTKESANQNVANLPNAMHVHLLCTTISLLDF